jgi:hypothetical protein
MTSSVLAALLAIAAGGYILFSQRRLATAALVVAFVTLGYISGSQHTSFGRWVQGVVDGVTAFVNWVSSAF